MEDQSICNHSELIYNNYDHLVTDGTTGHEKIVCKDKDCRMVWRPGDTKTHLAEYPFRFEEGVTSVENPTKLSCEDVLQMCRQQAARKKSIDAFAGRAVPNSIN